MGAPLDLLSDWKYAETGTGSGCPTARSTAGGAQGRNEVQGLFRETGARESGAFGGRPSTPRPVPVPADLRAHQLIPARDRRGHFDAVPETERDKGAGPSRQVGFVVPPFPRKAGSTLKQLLGRKPGGVTDRRRGLSSRTE